MSRDGTWHAMLRGRKENWKECDKDESMRRRKTAKIRLGIFDKKRRAKI
jgi:hypothetical protein